MDSPDGRTPLYPVWRLLDDRRGRARADVAWLTGAGFLGLAAAGACVSMAAYEANAILFVLGGVFAATTVPVWRLLARALVARWIHAHLPLDAMGGALGGVVRAHLVSDMRTDQGPARLRATWRVGRVGVHLHRVDTWGRPLDMDAGQGAPLAFTGPPWLGRLGGGMGGLAGVVPATETFLAVDSAHHLLHLLDAEATVVPSLPRDQGAARVAR